MKKMTIAIQILVVCFLLFLLFTCHQASKPTVHYNLAAVSYEEFIKTNENSILPSSSQNIYFSSHAEWQIINSFMRFEVPADQLDKTVASHVDALFTTPKIGIEKSEKMDQSVPIPDTLSPLRWWNVNEIKKGYSLEDKNGGGHTIWVDSEKNIIYIHYTQ